MEKENIYFWSANEVVKGDKIISDSGLVSRVDFKQAMNLFPKAENRSYSNNKELIDFLNGLNGDTIICWDLRKEYKVLSAINDKLESYREYKKETTPMMIAYKNFKVVNLQTMLDKTEKIEVYAAKYHITNEAEITAKVLFNFLKSFDRVYFDSVEKLEMSLSKLMRVYARYVDKDGYKAFQKIITANRPKTAQQYKVVEGAVWGGYGKSNFRRACENIKDEIHCFDITSQYPFVMLYKNYTLGTRFNEIKGTPANDWWMSYYLDTYNKVMEAKEFYQTSFFKALAASNDIFTKIAIAHIHLTGVKVKDSKVDFAFLPTDKIERTKESLKRQIFDGRIVSIENAWISMTMNDFIRLLEVYDVKSVEVDYVIYSNARNPHPFITNQVKKFVKEKQVIKNSRAKYEIKYTEIDYEVAKVKVNGLFGNIEKKYFYAKTKSDEEIVENLKKATITSNRMIGAMITAFGRDLEFALIETVISNGAEWLYSDTDSAYAICDEKTAKFIEEDFNTLIDVITNDKTYCGLGYVERKDYDRIKFVGRKAYYASNGDDIDLHLAGINLKDYVKKFDVECMDYVINIGTYVSYEVAKKSIPDIKFDSWMEGDTVCYTANKDLSFTISDPYKMDSYYVLVNRIRRQYGYEPIAVDETYVLFEEEIRVREGR